MVDTPWKIKLEPQRWINMEVDGSDDFLFQLGDFSVPAVNFPGSSHWFYTITSPSYHGTFLIEVPHLLDDSKVIFANRSQPIGSMGLIYICLHE